MESIKEWAVLMCTAAVTSGILVFLIPDGKLRKTADIVVTLFMLAVFISIFSDGELPELNIDIENSIGTEDYSAEFNEYILSQSKNTSEELIEAQLDEICNFPYSADTQWETSDNEVKLVDVMIIISQADSSKISNIKTKIGSLTGIIPEVNIR